ncbi:MAG: DegT/DnrJ/EryC1/StrS aminotransferase family protein [Rhodobacteraceae bacterium]|nr:DegT/DnrJ/EryC1/StrS aminotransferase family protein [Paracoccaceae bacterium]
MATILDAPWPNYSDAEIETVTRVLRSGKVNAWTGEETALFEQEFAKFSGTNTAIAVANGTLALDLALHGLGVGAHNGGLASDEVIVTPRSFMASASVIVNAGAVPVFADVDLDSQNISPETVAPHINRQTKAILCVHLAGWPCDMDGFKALVQGKNIRLIEDCAQAHGAKYKDRPVGGLGDVAAWSFCQDKIMSTGGEGGMVTCNDDDLWRRMWAFKDHGKSYAAVFERQHPDGFRWVHESFGSNFRLTEMQSAIGRIQLKKMPEWHKARNRNALDLTIALQGFVDKGWLRIPQIGDGLAAGPLHNEPPDTHGYYKFYAFFQPENVGKDITRDRIIQHFRGQLITCMQGSCSEIYLEKAFKNRNFSPATLLRNAKTLGETSLMFLVHPGLNYENLNLKMP